MKYSKYYELAKEEEVLSSGGETEDFNAMQQKFNKMFEDFEDNNVELNPMDFDSEVWCYEYLVDSEKGKQVLLDEVAKINQMPAYKTILTFLLLENKLAIGKDNTKGLWKYIQKGDIAFKSTINEKREEAFRLKLRRECNEEANCFENSDYETLLTILFVNLKEKYECNGCDQKKNWKGYFKKLLLKPGEEHVHELALGYQMDYKLFRVFRKKVLKYSGINFFDREQILLYFVIKYAKCCGEYRYFDSYRKLGEKYPVEGNEEVEKEESSTVAIQKDLSAYLEKDGMLKEEFRERFFQIENKDETIAAVFKVVDAMKRGDRVRTAEKLFKKLWKKFECALENSAEADAIYEFLNKTDDDIEISISYKKQLGKQNVYRWLYGMNVNKTEVKTVIRSGKEKIQTRIVDLKDKEMQVLGGGKEHFLDSAMFLETRIRDNTFSAFPVDEERQRNLLLTMVFLNFTFNDYNLDGDYDDRIEDFEIAATDVLADCGFQLLHNGNAYDAYLKLLLSCDMPLELFRYVWKLKTFSAE